MNKDETEEFLSIFEKFLEEHIEYRNKSVSDELEEFRDRLILDPNDIGGPFFRGFKRNKDRE